MKIPRRSFLRFGSLGILGVFTGSGCATPSSADRSPSGVLPPAGEWTADSIGALLAAMPLEDKVALLSGGRLGVRPLLGIAVAYNSEPITAGVLPEYGIPGIRFTDGPRGVVMYKSTCFPVAMARGATWDPELEEQVGDAIGIEARAQGANLFAGVCINLLRHPGWGRAQETYGEDPVHLGEMGAALVRGTQRHVMACIKHFACNSIENSRFKVNVEIAPRALHEVYLPHFKRCIDEGAASVMSAYNKVNGKYCGHNKPLLTGILRERWGFEGFVMSDFFLGVYDAEKAMNAGLDLEMPFDWRFGNNLVRAVRDGRVEEARIDEAARRILSQQSRFSTVGESVSYERSTVASPKHRMLAREVAADSMVLLKNEPVAEKPVLPLLQTIKKIAVFGRLAEEPNIGDEGSSMVRPPYIVTPLQGIRKAVGQNAEIVYDKGSIGFLTSRRAKDADVAIVVVGFTHEDEGENIIVKGGDRTSLRLRTTDEDLLLRVSSANPRTVAVMVGGSAIITEAWRSQVPAILMSWYAGMEGGNALAEVLFGIRSPGGKLPCVFPKSAGQLPAFDPKADSVTYDLFHGYRLLDRNQEEAAFAFGFGLSYTSFKVSAPRLVNGTTNNTHPIGVTIEVDVSNTGKHSGSEVVQLYAGKPDSRVERSPKELKAFKKVHLKPGESRTVRLTVPYQALAYFDETADDFVIEPGQYVLSVGASSRSSDLRSVTVDVGEA